MKRIMDLESETDGKKYGLNDMAKVGCNDCNGCSKCCRDMGNSIVLDPLDIFRLTGKVGPFEELLNKYIELNVVEGIILPNIKMQESGGCGFLNTEGRCSIHPVRPGICRIFPLGRMYEDGSFSYILQVNECPHPDKTKVKVGKWIDTESIVTNQRFVNKWHYFLKDVSEMIIIKNDPEFTRAIDMKILNTFYVLPYKALDEAEFYKEFEERLSVFLGS